MCSCVDNELLCVVWSHVFFDVVLWDHHSDFQQTYVHFDNVLLNAYTNHVQSFFSKLCLRNFSQRGAL